MNRVFQLIQVSNIDNTTMKLILLLVPFELLGLVVPTILVNNLIVIVWNLGSSRNSITVIPAYVNFSRKLHITQCKT